MEALYPASYSLNSSSDFLLPQIKSTKWTREENEAFERALAVVDEKRPDRWSLVAEMIPGKSVIDVINQYQELEADVNNIESGMIPVPGYLASSLTFELMENRGFDNFRKRGRSMDQERRRGIPWTEDEHRRFLMGLQAHGKGDWRNISRNFVISKTPTQVASHAQKYFLRQHSGGKDKKRPSIHDITTFNLPIVNPTMHDTKCASLDHKSLAMSPPPLQKPSNASKIVLDWNDSNEGLLMVFDSMDYDDSIGSLFDVATRGRYAANFCTADSKFHIQPRKYVI
ncbi:OLC1v1026712C1 [Oldenlandia corymbosa var. corymbosa]|uniref:OLC1v1026712C1 n=1 Tax=Oldenlandia corymbosa var. corymbosa TaxID=529605 RepID=A0AAV1C7R4_OLDCO|nr:OLC1v1026712C1 [Oldenlandia corymbosa var. corymbosa]